MGWERYRRKGFVEMRPYIPGEDLSEIFVSAQDDPLQDKGVIARNPDDPEDQWYVARDYFKLMYESMGRESER